MRKLMFPLIGVAGLASLGGAAIWSFRRNPRVGSRFVNSVVNPLLINRGLSGRGPAEIATLEHFGRRTGRRYLTPLHPEPTRDGFQIMVPLGEQSEWARNVVAAGHCRLQLHDVVYELDEPSMIRPTDLHGLPEVVRRLENYLGFEYIALREFRKSPGSLDEPQPTAEPHRTPEREPVIAAAGATA